MRYNKHSQKTLTREDLAQAVYEHHEGLSMREAQRQVDIVIKEMLYALVLGGTLKLHGFATFNVREQGERVGRNPQTGAPALVKAQRVVQFKASPNMRAAINAGMQPRRGA